MKGLFLKLILIFLTVFLNYSSQCHADTLLVGKPGTLFIREKIKDLQIFRDVFHGQSEKLKTHGFIAYSLHQDLADDHTVIVTLKCLDLEKGIQFARSPEFMAAFDKAGARVPMVWYGLDVAERKYTDQPEMTGGIVIARNEVRDFAFWKDCFYKEDGGKHNHPGRKYKNSNYSIHHLPTDPAVAIVVHEASDVSKAPVFMNSDPMVGEMESTGVIGLEVWYGSNLEEGLF